MHLISFPEANMRLHKPAEWTDEQCSSIDVYHGRVILAGGAETTGFVSCWQFTAEDMEEMIRNKGKIYIQVCSPAFYPIAVYPENPFVTIVPGPQKPLPPSPLIIQP